MKVNLPVLSVDLGGTKILAALVDGERIIYRDNSATGAGDGPDAVIDRICAAISRVLRGTHRDHPDISGISIAAAGAVDIANGVVTLSPSLPGWRNIPLVARIREKFPAVPVDIIHDANAAALGELTYGAGKGTRNMVFLTVSTGIGGGIIINGKEYHGADGAAGEIGHMTIDSKGPRCTCGNTGCLEVLASGSAMAREAAARIRKGAASSLTGMVDGKIERITAREVGAAAEGGDPLANEIIDLIAGYLGIGLVNIANIFNPEAIVIGGGVSNLGERLLAPARRVVMERAFPLSARTARIVRAELGEDSGVIGAAVFVASASQGQT
jgi:glucokinase